LSIAQNSCNCPTGATEYGTTGQTTQISLLTADNEVVCIHGTIETQDVYFNQATVYMDAEAEIVTPVANINYTDFIACSQFMYKGVKITGSNGGAAFVTVLNSKFFDARIGIELSESSFYRITHCTFDRNWTGIKLDGARAQANGITDCKFLCNGTLLEDASNTVGNVEITRQGIWAINQSFPVVYLCYFKDLHDGIRVESGRLNISNSNFRNLVSLHEEPCDYLAEDGGYAILLFNSTAGFIRDCGMFQLFTGIRAQSSDLVEVKMNQTDSVTAAIYDLNARSKSKIYENEFTFDRHGVYAISPLPGIAPIIQSNTFTISPRPTHPDRKAISLINAQGGAGDISLNEFSLDIGCWGIFLESSTGHYIHANDISFDLAKPEDVVLSTGIELRASHYNYLISNLVESSVQDENVPAGIMTNKSIGNIECCNTVINPIDAYRFTGDNTRTTWYGNRSQGSYTNGLLIQDGYFGPQPDTRNPKAGQVSENTWAPPQQSQRTDARLTRSFEFLSKIRAAGCSLPAWPQVINPSQSCSSNGTDWFTTVNVTVTTPCLSSSICQIPMTELRGHPEEYFSDTDIAVAEGELSGEKNGDILQWDGARQLYQLLRIYPDLLSEHASLDSFYDAQFGSNLMKLHLFDSLIYHAASIQYGDVLLMDSLVNLTSVYSIVLDSLFAELEFAEDEQDSTDLFEQMELFSDSLLVVDSILYSNDTMHLSWMSSVKASAQQILNYLSPSGSIETNEKSVRQLQLDLIFPKLLEADSTELADVFELANLCPLSSGNLVFLARSIYAHYKPEVLFDDEALCEEESELVSKNKDQIYSSYLNIKPNPILDWLELENGMEHSGSYDILIYDLMGRPMYSLIGHKESMTRVNTSEWPSGIYHILMRTEGISIQCIPFIKF